MYITKNYRSQLREKGWTVRELIELCCSCNSQCQDSRDRIYGVLSLANNDFGITPDYRKSVLELYMEASLVCAEGSDRIFFRETLQKLLQPFCDLGLICQYAIPDSSTISRSLDLFRWRPPSTSGFVMVHPLSVVADISFDEDAHVMWRNGVYSRADNRLLGLQSMNNVFEKFYWIKIFIGVSGDQYEHSCCPRPSHADHNNNTAFHRMCLADVGCRKPFHDYEKNTQNLHLLTPLINGCDVKFSAFSLFERRACRFDTPQNDVGIALWYTKPGDLLCHVGAPRKSM